jgi:hypothetical protein
LFPKKFIPDPFGSAIFSAVRLRSDTSRQVESPKAGSKNEKGDRADKCGRTALENGREVVSGAKNEVDAAELTRISHRPSV